MFWFRLTRPSGITNHELDSESLRSLTESVSLALHCFVADVKLRNLQLTQTNCIVAANLLLSARSEAEYM